MPHRGKQNQNVFDALSFYRCQGFSPRRVRKDVEMFSKSILLAATLMAVPLATAMAQQNNPAGNQGSNRSVTASPGTADSKAASGMSTGDVNSRTTGTSNYSGSSMSNNAPGATGKTVVPGSTSSQANSAAGTMDQKTNGSGGGQK